MAWHQWLAAEYSVVAQPQSSAPAASTPSRVKGVGCILLARDADEEMAAAVLGPGGIIVAGIYRAQFAVTDLDAATSAETNHKI